MMINNSFATDPTVADMPKSIARVIDRTQLAQLSDDVGSALTAIVETFRDEVRGRIVTMRRCLQTMDRESLAAEAHSIKGTAAMLGLVQLSANAKTLEFEADILNCEQLTAQVRTIQQSFQESCTALIEIGVLGSRLGETH